MTTAQSHNFFWVCERKSHEVMNIGQDLRYVTEEDFESFGGRQQRKDAWDVKTGWLGKMIFRNFNITYVHNGHTVFSHGDMEPEWAKLGVDTLNHQAQEAIWNSNFYAPIFRGTGKSCFPFWFEHKKRWGLRRIVRTIKKLLIQCALWTMYLLRIRPHLEPRPRYGGRRYGCNLQEN